MRDGTAGRSSYGGGRYVLDTAKGADLGSKDGNLVIDLNFLYHPSRRYADIWQCPLAPPGIPSAVLSAPANACHHDFQGFRLPAGRNGAQKMNKPTQVFRTV